MKIAQIAPLMESVPPRLYGGTERIVSYLTDELVRLGHEVTLFASADSVTAAKLVSCASIALRLDANVRDPIPYYMLMLDRVREYAEEFDILHFHIDQFHFPLFRQIANRTVTTLHGRQDLHDLKPLYVGFSDMPLVSISNAQRKPILNQPGIEFIGEIDERAKSDFLGNAQALLFPVDWPEPFGLSMIEAMACGTPVLAFRCGSVPEIIDPGVTGIMVDTMDEAIRMLPAVLALDRRAVRQRFEQRFSVARMAKDYVHVYRSLLKRPLLPEHESAMARLQPEMEKGMN